MDLCSEKHEEVCYSSRDCPVCASISEIEDLEKTIESLQQENLELEEKLELARELYPETFV